MSKFGSTAVSTPTYPTIPRVIRRAAMQRPRPIPAPKPVNVPVAPHHFARPNTVNAAGGLAFRKSVQGELLTLIFSALMSKKANKFYESEAATLQRLRHLVDQDPLFAAQCAVYARRVLGLRSISHAVAAMVVHVTKGVGYPWVRQFVEAVLFRADDAIEITAAYFHLYAPGKTVRKPNGKPGKKVPITLPNPLKRGIAKFLGGLGAYQLAKYKKESQAISLVDLFNIYHPKPEAENEAAVKAFVKGELKNTDTWEARLSEAGSNAIKKEEVWCKLFEERKLGYFAVLRNIRNILEQAPGAIDAAMAYLQNPVAIERCLILPFQFMRAYKEVKATHFPRSAEAARAIEAAVEISCRNIPKLPGTTLVALDESGSMGARDIEERPAAIGSLFSSIILKSQPGADFMAFSSTALYVNLDRSQSLFALTEQIRRNWHGGGTDFNTVFNTAKKAYDNIIILSDGEGWMGGDKWIKEFGAPTTARRQYERKFGCLPFITMFDLQGAGEMMFPEDSVAMLAGFSDKVFTLLRELRKDPAALANEVQKVDFARINEDDEN